MVADGVRRIQDPWVHEEFVEVPADIGGFRRRGGAEVEKKDGSALGRVRFRRGHGVLAFA